ncbi:MAG: hypothetical protein Q8O94_04020 [bacterium]|nr:hypothetical protein [bacterium]
MKRCIITLIIGAALTCAALGQQSMVLGGVISWDETRIEQAKGVDFGLIAYDSRNGSEADLIGFHDAVNGFYPVVPQCTWLEAIIDPTGFGRLEGVDYDTIGNLELNSRNWTPCRARRQGGFGVMIDTSDKLGPISFRFRIRHRDGKDKLNLVIFTATWIRGGNLFTRFRVTVQKEPDELRALRGEDRLPYLRGFIPATARAEGQVSQQKVEVPGQTVTQKLPKAINPPKAELGKEDPPTGDLQANIVPDPKIEYATVKIGAYQTSETGVMDLLRPRPSDPERKLLEDARTSVFEQSVTEVQLSNRRAQAVLVMSDDRPFTAEYVVQGKSTPLEVLRVNGRYEAVTWGKIDSFISKSILVVVTDSDGRTRTVNFTREVN